MKDVSERLWDSIRRSRVWSRRPCGNVIFLEQLVPFFAQHRLSPLLRLVAHTILCEPETMGHATGGRDSMDGYPPRACPRLILAMPSAVKPEPRSSNVPGSGTELPPPPPPPVVVPPFKPPLLTRLPVQPPPTVFGSSADSPLSTTVPTPSKCTRVFARALPQSMVAPGSKVMAVGERIFPAQSVLSPRVARPLLWSTQYTLLPAPRPLVSNVVPLPVVSELLIRNTNSPVPVRVSVEFGVKSRAVEVTL